jgi:hypothetical protein
VSRTSTTAVSPDMFSSSTTTTAVPFASTSSAPPCEDGQISVSDNGGGSGLGHQDQVLRFLNVGSRRCALRGYPGIAGLDASGHQVVQAQRTLSGYLGGLQDGSTALPDVTLNPGEVASAVVEGTDNPSGTETSCPSYPYLLVTPPGLTVSTRLTVTGLGNSEPGLPGCTRIEIHPVVPGGSGISE